MKLFVFGNDQRRAAAAMAAIWGIDAKRSKEINTWVNLAKEIGQHQKLDELVLDYHGWPGGILLDDGGFTLTEPQVPKYFGKVKTKIEHIRFEGCWVGEAPDAMAAFGRLFDAQAVSGFTWACWSNEIEVTLPKGITAADLKKHLAAFETWLMPGTPSIAQLASMARQREVKKKLALLWYQYSTDEKPPYANNNFQRLGRHSYKTRADATARTIDAKNAKTSESPSPPFEYVTVKLR